MENIIAIIVIQLIIGLAVLYIILSKKKGHKCIGCPFSKTCNKNQCDRNKMKK